MPLYSYRCTKCDHGFEMLVRSSDVPACPECASEEVERQLSLTVAEGASKGIIQRARAQAAREGHFSNYGKSERPKLR